MGDYSVALCCVAGGDTYLGYAEDLRETAAQLFWPGTRNSFVVIPGEEGWPNGTMYRWHRLLENMPDADYVFLCDADMRIESIIGPEILSLHVTLTEHPGFVELGNYMFPYERRSESACYIPTGSGFSYFCGGFAGGPRGELTKFATRLVELINVDAARGVVPAWHDESALNKVAHTWDKPLHVLDPSYCHPDNDSHYKDHIWSLDYPRRIVALDKSEDERGQRQ